ncbi:hypothetical protein AMECASPLE_032790 [Ameca splendens]|uniref:Uncharacterized protein n=1 Tax=Ameca splendens TaxID=208324 RepID=A0ABV0ZFG8_9TELE
MDVLIELVVYLFRGCGGADHLKIHGVELVFANSMKATAVLSASSLKKKSCWDYRWDFIDKLWSSSGGDENQPEWERTNAEADFRVEADCSSRGRHGGP